jgi:hypothetical protein
MSIFSQRFSTSGKRRVAAGFTIVELLVATGIIVVITVVLLFRHDQFNSSTLLRSLSYGVALSVRQAQFYGTSVRETGVDTNVFAQSYGVYFKDGSPDQYFLAADINGNGTIATDGSEDVPPSPYRIQSGYGVSDFCAYTTSVTHCHSGGTINELLIRFIRPNPDAIFSTNQSAQYIRACIALVSPAGNTRTVEVTNTGQISVGEAGEVGEGCPD